MKGVLVIYTGGTIGMIPDPKNGALLPFNFDYIYDIVPEISQFDFTVDIISFSEPKDSSDFGPKDWEKITKAIANNYDKYAGFVVLTGSDTMAYTASALSFMLENLIKPVVLTGSMLPIGLKRTDARENLIASIEIAGTSKELHEVTIFFEDMLFRGNRTTKISSNHFDAFNTPNYPILGEAGVGLNFHPEYFLPKPSEESSLIINNYWSKNVASIKMYPGISNEQIAATLSIKNLKAVVIETFGSGNARTERKFLTLFEKAIKNDILILNISQCLEGAVEQGKYSTSQSLKSIGVVSGLDLTFEAAITKCMYLFGRKELSLSEIKHYIMTPIRGELTIPN